MAETCVIKIEDEPSTSAGVTGVPTIVTAALSLAGEPCSLSASGLLNAVGKETLALSFSSMCLAVESSAQEVRASCEEAARVLLPPSTVLTWDAASDPSRAQLVAQCDASPLATVDLVQLYLDQELHILTGPNGGVVVLDRAL